MRQDPPRPGGPTHVALRRFVVMSGYHDYRSKRKANLHFIADELRHRGSVFFFSFRFSLLSRWKPDPRHGLEPLANHVATVGGVDCYLWRTPIHPFGMPRPFALLEKALFGVFARRLPQPAREAIAAADTIFIESGMAIIYLPLIRRLNPAADVIYMASDSLDAIGQAEAVKAAFCKHAALVTWARIPSPHLRADVPPGIPCRYIPHGIEKARFDTIGPSPFRPGTRNAVAVGSMLFDPGFFAIAGPMFPDVLFHCIGSGHSGPDTENVTYHPEMPFAQTLPYLQHCTIAIAPYGIGVEPYLTHTSMKLLQYNYLGLRAVCPNIVAGTGLGRFGYRPGDAASIRMAMQAAFAGGHIEPQPHPSWSDVTDQLLATEPSEAGLVIPIAAASSM